MSRTWPPIIPHAGGVGQFHDRGCRQLGIAHARNDELEGKGVEGVAGQDGEGLAVDFVVGGPAAAEVVVVHGGKVIVDEGEAVDHLDGAGRPP